MHLVIISGAAGPQASSNTVKIIAAFREGFEESANTSETWFLSNRRQWVGAAQAFAAAEHILIALPLYLENVPGILLEFLAGLTPKAEPGTKLSFLLQGGFPETCQGRCCEAYLETLPAKLGCEYGGTMIRGNMFGASLVDEKSRVKMLAPFAQTGRAFAAEGCFDAAVVARFAAPEFISRFFMGHIAKKLGCKDRLDAQPYAQYLQNS